MFSCSREKYKIVNKYIKRQFLALQPPLKRRCSRKNGTTRDRRYLRATNFILHNLASCIYFALAARHTPHEINQFLTSLSEYVLSESRLVWRVQGFKKDFLFILCSVVIIIFTLYFPIFLIIFLCCSRRSNFKSKQQQLLLSGRIARRIK